VSDDQQRAAERIPLENPIEVTLNDVQGRIVEISLIGCRVEHAGRVNMGSTVTMQFRWMGETIKLKAKVTRTEMRPIAGKPGYVSALELAGSLIESPPPLRRLVAGLIEKKARESQVPAAPEPDPVEEPAPPPPAAKRVSAATPTPKPNTIRTPTELPAKQKPPAPAAKPAPPPVARPKPAEPPAKPKPPAPVAKPAPPPYVPDILDDDEIEEITASDEIRDDEQIEEVEQTEEIDESPPSYVECTFVGGKWITRPVTDPKQPREGFTMLTPDSEDEIRQYCHTYEVADADIRRMIRASFEVAIAERKRG
jgi:PilZ domain